MVSLSTAFRYAVSKVNYVVILLAICHVSVGDSVLLKDPENSGDYLIRKLAAIEGYEMFKGGKEEPFVLEKGECWVLTDNENINPEGVRDSRSFGPVPMSHIFGRVIYILKTAISHGLPNNSPTSLQKDKPILEIELDIDEMVKARKTIIERVEKKS